jgi:hypothetical protein
LGYWRDNHGHILPPGMSIDSLLETLRRQKRAIINEFGNICNEYLREITKA